MDQNEINDAVARGAALLDEKAPGWIDKIDLSTLNIASDRLCILGQVYEDYEDFAGASGELFDLLPCCCECAGYAVIPVAAHGFDIDDFTSYKELLIAWKAHITARRDHVVVQLLEDGWLLSRDSLSMISPATGREALIAEPLAGISLTSSAA